MKRTASLLLVTLVSCFCALAQTAKTRRPTLPIGIAATAGQDSATLLKDPAIQIRLQKLLGQKYDSFMESFETLNPVTREGNFLFSSGCLIYACTHLESAIAIDLTNKTIHAAVFRQTERTRYFNEGGRATPKAIRDWAYNLRQLNSGTNSSQSKSAFATPDAAGTQVVVSPARRLRSLVPVRGFIGGESHDGYLVRAREGHCLRDWYHDKRLGGVCNHLARSHMKSDLHRYLFASCYAKLNGKSPELRDFPQSLLPEHENVKDALKGNFFSDRFRVQLSNKPASTITSHISKDGHYYIHPS